jgi:aminopeptidase
MEKNKSILKNFASYLDHKPGESILFLVSQYAVNQDFFKEKYLENDPGIKSFEFMNITNKVGEVRKRIPKFDVIVFLESIGSSLSEQILKYLAKNIFPNQRFYRVYNFSPELFTNSFNVNKSTIEDLNHRIISAGVSSKVVEIKNSFGTDLEIKLNRKFGWIHSFGNFSGKSPGILPPSEVATYSDKINGVLVADGAINTNFNVPLNPVIENFPITATIENSVVKEIKTEFKVLNLLLNRYIKVKYANRIGEVGFGTNIGMKGFVPFISHINERYPSLHLGLGANNQGSVVNWHSPLHLDLILKNCQIFFDDKQILNNGKYLLENLTRKSSLNKVKIGYADTV